MSFDQDPNETAQISGSDFAQMCDEMKQLRAERDALRQTAHNNSVFWSARDGTGELQHYKASPAEASKIIVALGNERDAARAERDMWQADAKQRLAERDDAAALAKNYAERMARSDAELAAARAERDALRVAFGLAPDERIPAQTPRPGSLLVETGSIRRRVSLTDERDADLAAAQQAVARLREVLQRIVNNGGSATNVMLFDARTALAQ